MGVPKGSGPARNGAGPAGGPWRGRVWMALLLGGAVMAGAASASGLPAGSGDPVDPAPVDPTQAELGVEVSIVPDTLAFDGYRLVLHQGPAGERVDAEAARRVAETLDERRPRIRAFLDEAWGSSERSSPAPDIEVHLHPTLETKALATGEMSVAHVDHDARQVHFSMQEGLEGFGLAFEAMVAVRDHLYGAGPGRSGDPDGPEGAEAPPRALEVGLAVHLSDGWLGAEPEEWVGRLWRARLVPSLERLMDDDLFSAGSMLAHPAMAAVLVDWLVQERGSEGFAEVYGAGPLAPPELEVMEPGWTAHLAGLGSAAPPPGPAPGPPDPPAAFRQGFNFAHEGYQIYNGYGSREARVSLERMAGLGSNAVAIVPYTFLRDPSLPGPLTISNRVGSENDAAVLNSALASRELGLSVLLKPHIWLRGSWPGEVRMESEEAWDLFFEEYARWIGHYALMAEAYGLESFCMGNEMSAAALEQPHRWRELAGRIREVYRGELGYCANWGEEVESLQFWDAVDFIGVSFYYPLASGSRPSDRALVREANRVLTRLEELGRCHDRPVLLTEAGFASSPAPWREPWTETRGSEAQVALDDQARAYRALIQALGGREEIAGVFWWKWPTVGPRDPDRHPGFTPAGKPAQEVISRWFGPAVP